MVMAVGFGFGPDEEDPLPDVDATELGCPDPEDLLGADELPPPALLLAADPSQLPGQWVDHGMSAWFAHTNQMTLQLARWMLEASRASASTRERVPVPNNRPSERAGPGQGSSSTDETRTRESPRHDEAGHRSQRCQTRVVGLWDGRVFS
jgi:hypothetical protein